MFQTIINFLSEMRRRLAPSISTHVETIARRIEAQPHFWRALRFRESEVHLHWMSGADQNPHMPEIRVEFELDEGLTGLFIANGPCQLNWREVNRLDEAIETWAESAWGQAFFEQNFPLVVDEARA